jgi:hypothetical protein
MVCACHLSRTHGHFLCYTTVGFIQPAAAFVLWRGQLLLGSTALALGMTSLAYHGSHAPRLRAVDVALAQLTGTIGVVQCLLHIHAHGWSVAKVCALLLVATVLLLNHGPAFRQASRPDVLSLPGHVAMHAATGAALVSMTFAMS